MTQFYVNFAKTIILSHQRFTLSMRIFCRLAFLFTLILTTVGHVNGQLLPGFSRKEMPVKADTIVPVNAPVSPMLDSIRSTVIESIPELYIEPTTNIALDTLPVGPMSADSLITVYQPRPVRVLDAYNFRPVVFDTYTLLDSVKLAPYTPNKVSPQAFAWLEQETFNNDLIRRARQNYFISLPQLVRYNERLLPEPPKKYRAEVDPLIAKIVVKEIPVNEQNLKVDVDATFERRNWMHDFNGTIQFSQAYLSPNWYQGGTNNLNMLIGARFDVKLNPAFYPNLLVETTVSYKLGLNSATDDELRNYSISEDLFQVNAKLGYKAARRWYYSLTGVLKTQFLNNYKKNTNTLQAAFFSPGELNLGVGMTYNLVTPSKAFSLDAAISPFSYNLKTCFNNNMDVTSFGIKTGHKTVSEIGSSGECKITWKLASNIKLQSRLFVFTDYNYVQSDWENTIAFTINKFLSTQIYAHLRYDSSTETEAKGWHDWQLKEILSFGFSYLFSSYK